MITVNKLLPQGQGLSTVLLKRSATVALDWDTRQKSRFDTEDSQGRALGVFLPRGTAVRGGDVLVAEDGSLIKVLAQPQPVMRITPCAEHGSSFDLARAAYHLGNRHVQLELAPNYLQIEPDHVLAEMLVKMHLDVAEMHVAFEPEGGAYSAHAGHAGHERGQGHDHGHVDGDRATHERTPARDHAGHVHGPDCKHDH
jgi:urease accessory protein